MLHRLRYQPARNPVSMERRVIGDESDMPLRIYKSEAPGI
jgi:hypothetical protein